MLGSRVLFLRCGWLSSGPQRFVGNTRAHTGSFTRQRKQTLPGGAGSRRIFHWFLHAVYRETLSF